MKLINNIATTLAVPAIISIFSIRAQALTPSPEEIFVTNFSNLNFDDYLDKVAGRVRPRPPIPCPSVIPDEDRYFCRLENTFIPLDNNDLSTEQLDILLTEQSSNVTDQFPNDQNLSFFQNAVEYFSLSYSLNNAQPTSLNLNNIDLAVALLDDDTVIYNYRL